jgi:hypothetical protein
MALMPYTILDLTFSKSLWRWIIRFVTSGVRQRMPILFFVRGRNRLSGNKIVEFWPIKFPEAVSGSNEQWGQVYVSHTFMQNRTHLMIIANDMKPELYRLAFEAVTLKPL